MSGMSGKTRPALTREAVTRAALRLLDEVGLEGLTTRRLAAELGVQSPALYWHFRTKQDLLGEMAEAVIVAVGLGPRTRASPGPSG
jgi:TetR/AcrR family transcriptional regulator, tetracycline repressor protein